eukprot:3940948-Rhodomonas_salina.3
MKLADAECLSQQLPRTETLTTLVLNENILDDDKVARLLSLTANSFSLLCGFGSPPSLVLSSSSSAPSPSPPPLPRARKCGVTHGCVRRRDLDLEPEPEPDTGRVRRQGQRHSDHASAVRQPQPLP